MSSILDLAISISLADHISSGIRSVISQFRLMENATEDAQRRMDKFKNMAFVGGGIGVAGAIAFKQITDGISEAARAAMEFEDVMINVKLAAFGKDLINQDKAAEVKKTLGELTEGFEKLGMATKFSDKGVAEAALGMLRGGIDKEFLLGTKNEKGNFNYSGLTAAMYAAQLGQIDPNASGDFIAKQKAAFNISGDRTLSAIDFYAKTAAASTMGMKDLIPGMLTSSGVAGTLGMTPEDTALLVAATGTYTKDGGAAGTFTKDFLDRLIPHTKKQKQAMAELGWMNADGKSSIFFDESTGKSKGADFMFNTLQAASKKYRPDEFQNLMHKVFLEQGKNAALALANGSEIYMDIKNKVGNQLDMYQQVEQQMEGTKNRMETLAETWNIVKRVFGDPFLEPIKNALNGLGGILGDFVIPWAKAHPQIIKTVATVALGISAFMAIGGAILVGVAAFGALSTALSVAGVGFGTIALVSGGVVLAIAAIAGAAYLIYKHWDKILPFITGIWDKVKSVSFSVWAAIGPTIMSAVNNVWNSIKTAFSRVQAYMQEIWPDVKKVIDMYWPLISGVIILHFKIIWTGIQMYANLIWITMKHTWTIISEIVKVAWTLIKDTVVFWWDFISGVVKFGLKVLQGDWSGAWEVVKETASKLWVDLGRFFRDGWEGLKSIGSTWLTASKQWGSDIVDGIIIGIKGMWNNLKDTINDLSNNFLVGPLKKVLGINSPSRVMMENGGYITQGLAIGMMSQAGLVKGASESLSKAVQVQGSGSNGIRVNQPLTAAGGININGPLIGEVHQQPGEDTGDFAARVAELVIRKLNSGSQKANMTIGSRGLLRRT
ncbi:phage tail tape measure protein [Bacillus sp. 3255]|uniref:phage tail tape measure protein n=1 Tax=Bacillus sp. 3255 TaxID=2817904 RepID=UPI0028671E7E|nr:phage tail tape measure protein [Bacillus sp. 3255]MDR6883020.1 TP901 family phage tail tape measure protein [Bacillus sp. 3255]